MAATGDINLWPKAGHTRYILPSTQHQACLMWLLTSPAVNAVHNVGTNIRKATVDYSDDEYQLIMSANLESTYKLSQVCLSC